jgi:hydroxymethylpyrimidine pyrophosphatase-like HAD family hydrolase
MQPIPPLTLCTGRPMPYAEAVAQMMGIERPVIFENAGAFDPQKYQIIVDKIFTDEIRSQIDDIKHWLQQEIMSRFEGMTLEFTKLMDAGIIHPEKAVLKRAFPRIKKYVAENYPGFIVHKTDVSINIILGENGKQKGIKTLCRLENIALAETAYIGDTIGDIPGLKVAGRAFAPRNALGGVKKISRVIPYECTKAVLHAYKEVISQNRRS